MRNEEIFRALWKNLQEEMVAGINFQINNRRDINHQEIRKLYGDQLSRWSSRMSPEGAWLLEVEDERAKKEVLAAISTLDLHEEESDTVKKQIPIITGGLWGGAVCVLTVILHLSAVLSVLGFAAGLGAGCAFENKRNSSIQKTRMNKVKNSYIRQIERDGEKIAAIWRKHDG